MSIHQTAPVSLLSMNGQFVALAAASCSTAGGGKHPPGQSVAQQELEAPCAFVAGSGLVPGFLQGFDVAVKCVHLFAGVDDLLGHLLGCCLRHMPSHCRSLTVMPHIANTNSSPTLGEQ